MDFDLLELRDEDMDAFYGEVTTTVEAATAAVKKQESALVPAKPATTGQKIGLIGVSIDLGISIYEAKLRIFDCCEELGLTSDNPVLYSDVQQVYRDKHKVSLNKDELKKLFGSQKAKSIINDRFKDELYCEAEDSSDGAPQLIKLHPEIDIHQIISILEEKTALDKMGREADEAEALSVTLGPPVVPPKPFKQPDRLLPTDFKVVDCRNSKPAKNVFGFKNRHKKPAPDAIQTDNDEDFDADALWKEQVEESKRLAIQRSEMILQMRRAAEEAARKEAEEAEKDSEGHFNPETFADAFLGRNAERKVVEVEKPKVVEVEKPKVVEVEKPKTVEVEQLKDVVDEKRKDVEPGILTMSIAQPVDAAIFPELAKSPTVIAERPIPPPRKPVSATKVSPAKPTTIAQVSNPFPVTPIAAPTTPIIPKPSIFAPKPLATATLTGQKPIAATAPTTTVSPKPFGSTLPTAAVDPKPSVSVPTPVPTTTVTAPKPFATNTPSPMFAPKPFKATIPIHGDPKPFARNPDPLVNYNPRYPNVKMMPPRKFVTPQKSSPTKSTNPPPSPRFTSTVNPAPTLAEKAAISTNVIDDLNISPQSNSSSSSNKSSKKTGTSVIYIPPKTKSKSSSPSSKLPTAGFDDSVDARIRLQAITNDIGHTFKKATKKVDRYIEEVLRAEEEAIAEIKKKNDGLVKEYKKKMEARLQQKLEKKLAEQERLMMICKAMNGN
uniref:PHD-type domain-containing protein n=1 Tax=Panagrellus redivivus TaxID=6233 RepID=A0A7E4ZUV5_PANRE